MFIAIVYAMDQYKAVPVRCTWLMTMVVTAALLVVTSSPAHGETTEKTTEFSVVSPRDGARYIRPSAVPFEFSVPGTNSRGRYVMLVINSKPTVGTDGKLDRRWQLGELLSLNNYADPSEASPFDRLDYADPQPTTAGDTTFIVGSARSYMFTPGQYWLGDSGPEDIPLPTDSVYYWQVTCWGGSCDYPAKHSDVHTFSYFQSVPPPTTPTTPTSPFLNASDARSTARWYARKYLKVVQPKASCKRVSRTRFKCTVTGKRKSRKVTVRVTAYLQNGDFYGARG